MTEFRLDRRSGVARATITVVSSISTGWSTTQAQLTGRDDDGAVARSKRAQRPVWPKPPPRFAPSSAVDLDAAATGSTRWTTSWAMRSPRWIS